MDEADHSEIRCTVNWYVERVGAAGVLGGGREMSKICSDRHKDSFKVQENRTKELGVRVIQ